jgi:hypothetical protein
MDWKAAAAIYLDRLEHALTIQRRAVELADLPQAGVPEDHKKALTQHVDTIRRQRDRLRNNEFRIAVVGLEKAGKSTFVNAWLECDLLPNDSQRCTYTTTQVCSVPSTSEQRLEVYPRTPEQFEEMKAQLELKAKAVDPEGARNARQDLESIQKHHVTLRSVLDEGRRNTPQCFPFTRLDQVAEHLKKYVADERYTYAVAEARLYTTQLTAAEGIVFYDVPGLNSGMDLHLKQSEEMLKDCDAVILIQRSTTPSIEAHEQRLMVFVQQGDELVGIAGKLFVFLGRVLPAGLHESS